MKSLQQVVYQRLLDVDYFGYWDRTISEYADALRCYCQKASVENAQRVIETAAEVKHVYPRTWGEYVNIDVINLLNFLRAKVERNTERKEVEPNAELR